MEQPTHALFIVDNWDGQGDRYWVFANQINDVWHGFENGKPLLEHQGDEILKIVPLT